jgi:hypothetical protein
MKSITILLTLLFFFISGYSQLERIDAMVNPNWKSTVQDAGVEWVNKGYLIKGSIYYQDEMHKGYVTLDDGRSAKDVPIRYNLYSHQVSYMENGVEMELDKSAPVHEFGYTYTKDDEQKTAVFRSGYPPVAGNNNRTFYEVIADGNISLLKYVSKKFLEERTELGAMQKSIIDTDSWFVYNALDKNIVEIKRNKNSLMEALPQYAEKIKSITEKKKLRLKSDADWIILLTELSAK